MTHSKGDRVTNTVPVGPTIPAGTPGTVTEEPDLLFDTYTVRFDTHNGDQAMAPHEIEAQQ